MLTYNSKLKSKARQLRRNLTDSERALWSRLRNKQVFGVQFYRQKPIGGYIVDFYAPGAKLVIEVDGGQHLQGPNVQNDGRRDVYLASLGLKVIRFNSREVMKESDAVVEVICRSVEERFNTEIPPRPPFSKGGIV